MGIVDPMIIGNAANGAIQYGDAHMLSAALLGMLAAAAVGLVVSAWGHLGVAAPRMARPAGLGLPALGAVAK